jgi:hypothetical protein
VVILTLTFLLGCGNAVASPSWQAIQPDLVERSQLPQAAALNGVNMNLAWAEHQRQHEQRLTGADRRFEEEARRYTLGAPEVAHLFPPPVSATTKR